MAPTKNTQPRRKNVTTACDPCRDSKIKCDANQPQCDNCKSKGKPCVYRHFDDKRRQASLNRKAVQVLGRRIRHLERFIRHQNLTVPRPDPDDEVEIQRMLDSVEENGAEDPDLDFLASHVPQPNPTTFPIAGDLPAESSSVSPGSVRMPDWLIDFSEQPHLNFESIPGIESTPEIDPSLFTAIGNIPQIDETRFSSHETRLSGSPACEHLGEVISSRKGTLKSLGGSEFRYFGATSNLTLLDGYSGPEERRSVKGSIMQGQEAIRSAGLDFDVDPSLLDHLTTLYFTWQNASFHVVDKESFDRVVQEPSGDSAAKCSSEALVNIICAFGALYSDQGALDLPSPLSEFFAKRAKIWLDIEIERPRFTTVQTLSIFSCYEAARGRDGKGWLYSGMAMRLSFDLGLRLDMSENVANGQMTLDEAESRKIAFWGSFVIDHHWALYLGRPPFRLNFDDVSVQLPAVHEDSEDAEIVVWDLNRTDTIIDNQSVFCSEKLIMRQWIKLCEIMSSLNQVLYEMPGAPLETLQSVVQEGVQKVESWRGSLPPILETDRSEQNRIFLPHILLLHMQYHHFMIHIYRPFISVTNGMMDTHNVRTICIESAISISKLIQIYQSHYSLRRMNIEAVSIIFSAAVMLVFASISDLGGCNTRELAEHLNACSQALVELGETFRIAGRTLDVLLAIKRQWQARLLVSTGEKRGPTGSAMGLSEKRARLS